MNEAVAQGMQHVGHEEELWKVLEWVMGGVMILGGILIKVIWSRQTELYQAQVEIWKGIATVQLQLANDYVKEDDFKEAINKLEGAIHTSSKEMCDRMSSLESFLRQVPLSPAPPRRP